MAAVAKAEVIFLIPVLGAVNLWDEHSIPDFGKRVYQAEGTFGPSLKRVG